MTVKGVAIAASDHSENIRKLLLQEYDLVEFDPLQILAQEMVTPILLRSGMPIDCLNYTSGEMLFKSKYLDKARQGDIISPVKLVHSCRVILESLPIDLISELSKSIDLGKPRLVMADFNSLTNFRNMNYIVIESHRTREIIISIKDDSFLVMGTNPLKSVLEIINRNELLPRLASN